MDFRAHISDDGREQSVKEHCEAVSELCREYGKKIGLENLCSLEGLSHDGGKLCGDFNNYIAGNSSFSRGEIDHSFAGAKYLSDLCTKIECKAIKKIAARVICSHHGLQDWLNENSENTLVKRLDKKDRWDEIEENIKATFDERATIELIKKANEEYVAFKNRLFEWCKENYPDVKTEAKGFFLFLLERMLLSMLVSADRGDTADFMAGEKLGISYDNNSVFSGMEDKIEEINKAFSTLTDPISLKRQDISNRCKAFFDNKRSIVRLVVPTGGGKTLSSMRFAASYCKKFNKDRIIYTAPFMSILEQNSDTIRGLMPDESLYLEHHSDILSTMGSGNDLELYELRTERWDNPVISTTLVQLLNTLFSGKMSSVARMHRLCNSVIIIDEVQSIPIKCIYMFNMAMSFLAEFCNTTVVLCSATQPSLEDIKYKMCVDKDSSMTGDYSDDFSAFKRTRLDFTYIKPEESMSYFEAAAFANDLLGKDDNNSILFIVNTKAAAKEIYDNLKQVCPGEVQLIYLTTNMCPAHRKETIRNMKDSIKESREGGKKLICVSTQLIEAGVDVSFSCVIRSFAGLDSISQAAGRCNRNGEYDCKTVYVVKLFEEKLSRLKYITTAQSSSESVIYNTENKDPQSPDVMTEYYDRLFKDYGKELCYPVKDLDTPTDLINMLSVAKIRQDDYVRKTGAKRDYFPLMRTAGKLFEVIDNNTKTVIVPYNDEARDIINKLNSDIFGKELNDCLRKAQKYSVELYSSTEKKLLEENALYNLKCGAIAVKEEFYSAIYGITTEGSNMEVLSF